jgi:hypothetical protein
MTRVTFQNCLIGGVHLIEVEFLGMTQAKSFGMIVEATGGGVGPRGARLRSPESRVIADILPQPGKERPDLGAPVIAGNGKAGSYEQHGRNELWKA